MDLRSFIKALGGPKAFSKRYPWISYRAAVNYAYGIRWPKPEVARRIVAETPVTWEGIYGVEFEPLNKRAAKKRPKE